jgi:hypothetical protein
MTKPRSDQYEYRVKDIDDPDNWTREHMIMNLETARAALRNTRRSYPWPERIVMERRPIAKWEQCDE